MTGDRVVEGADGDTHLPHVDLRLAVRVCREAARLPLGRLRRLGGELLARRLHAPRRALATLAALATLVAVRRLCRRFGAIRHALQYELHLSLEGAEPLLRHVGRWHLSPRRCRHLRRAAQRRRR